MAKHVFQQVQVLHSVLTHGIAQGRRFPGIFSTEYTLLFSNNTVPLLKGKLPPEMCSREAQENSVSKQGAVPQC
jgi:hypothetical protein